jgi:hypothetical protein
VFGLLAVAISLAWPATSTVPSYAGRTLSSSLCTWCSASSSEIKHKAYKPKSSVRVARLDGRTVCYSASTRSFSSGLPAPAVPLVGWFCVLGSRRASRGA